MITPETFQILAAALLGVMFLGVLAVTAWAAVELFIETMLTIEEDDSTIVEDQ